MTNDEARMISTLRAPLQVAAKQNSDSVFGFRPYFRHSSLGIRHFGPEETQKTDDPPVDCSIAETGMWR